MKVHKLLKQFGTHGNEYNLDEVGDMINTLIDIFISGEKLELHEEKKEEITAPVTSEIPKNQEGGMAVRSPASGDRVYYVKDGKKKWVKNPETLNKLGFNFSTTKNITNAELDAFESDGSIDLVVYEPEEVPSKVTPKEEIKNENDYESYNI